jgi:hypothetical protein
MITLIKTCSRMYIKKYYNNNFVYSQTVVLTMLLQGPQESVKIKWW